MPDTEYEDSIDKFINKGPNGPQQMIPQQMMQGPQGPQGPSQGQQVSSQGPSQGQQVPSQGPSQEQIAMMQQQKMMQQRAMQQQAMQQQAMQQQAMQQQNLMKQNNKNKDRKEMTFFEKLKTLKNNETLQEIFIIAILFIIFSTSFYKDNLTKIPFVTNDNNCLNTSGLLISAILIAIIFVIIRTFL